MAKELLRRELGVRRSAGGDAEGDAEGDAWVRARFAFGPPETRAAAAAQQAGREPPARRGRASRRLQHASKAAVAHASYRLPLIQILAKKTRPKKNRRGSSPACASAARQSSPHQC